MTTLGSCWDGETPAKYGMTARLPPPLAHTAAHLESAADSANQVPATVAAMQSYYQQRAATYERVYHKPERQADLRAMEAWVTQAFAGLRVLELAAGTGWWTLPGAQRAVDWLATDLNPETWAVAQAKPLPPCVHFAALDVYALDGAASLAGQPFDAAFAGCWWSHVPLSRLGAFVAALHRRLQPGARVVFLDNSYVQTSSSPLTRRDAAGNTYQLRSLDDGSQHEVLKNFPTAEEARAVLGDSAEGFEWIEFTHYWVLSYSLRRAG